MPFSQAQDPDTYTSLTDELKLIPQWAVGFSFVSFLAVEYLFWVVLPQHRHHPGPPAGFHAYFAISWGLYAALYALAIGYVSNDAPRRSMSTPFWILACLLAPGGVGAVLYFLMRQPIASTCPSCGTRVHSDYHYCPQCAFQVTNSCGVCFRSARITDLYCVHCGHELAKDNAPARLRAFTIQD
jgi:hypothetical protein